MAAVNSKALNQYFKYYRSTDRRLVSNLATVKEWKLQTKRVSPPPTPLFKHSSRFKPVHLSQSVSRADWLTLTCPAATTCRLLSPLIEQKPAYKTGAKFTEPVDHKYQSGSVILTMICHLVLRRASQSWINVGINWTRVAFRPSLSDSWSLFFSSQSPLLWSVCILAGYQSGVVSPSAGFPERRGMPPHPPTRTSGSWTSAHQHWEEAALPGFHETWRNCRDLGENTEKRKKTLHIEGGRWIWDKR